MQLSKELADKIKADIDFLKTHVFETYGININVYYRVAASNQVQSLDDVISTVCNTLGYKYQDVFEKTRKRPLVEARDLIFYYAHCVFQIAPLKKIGAKFDLDHSTVIHGRDLIKNLIYSKDRDILIKVNQLNAAFGI